jgi:Ima1 N-terminal domain
MDHVPPSPIDKVRYADSQQVSTKQPSPNNDRTFCATCLKNQHVLTQSLATYLPSPTDPRYPAFKAAYPKYRQQLEERYPQVCSECEEGVVKRIRQADYMANTAYLGWKIEATRNAVGRKSAQRWGWRSLLISVGGANWYSSLLLQGLWHIHAAKAQKRVGPGWRAEPFLWSCLALKDNPDCVPFTAYLARIGLAQAVMSIWWNNQLWRKPLGTKVQLIALDDYYALQFLILSVRAGAWWASQNDVIISLNQESLRASHLFMLAFLVLVSLDFVRS